MGDMLWFCVEEFDVAHNRLEELLGNGHVLITADVASHQLQVETRHHINVIIRFWIILIAIATAHTEEATVRKRSHLQCGSSPASGAFYWHRC